MTTTNKGKSTVTATVADPITKADAIAAAGKLDDVLKRSAAHMLTLARYRNQTSKTSKSGKPVSFAALAKTVGSTSTATSSSALGRYATAEQAHTALTKGKGEGDSVPLMGEMVKCLGQTDKKKRPTGEELSHLVAEALVAEGNAVKAWSTVYGKWVKANEASAKAEAEARKESKDSSTDEADETVAPSLGKGDTSGHGDTGNMSISEALSTAERLVRGVTERLTPAEASLYEANVASLSVAVDMLSAKVA